MKVLFATAKPQEVENHCRARVNEVNLEYVTESMEGWLSFGADEEMFTLWLAKATLPALDEVARRACSVEQGDGTESRETRAHSPTAKRGEMEAM